VPINAVCPECQNHFRLHEQMVGKTMRCTVCQEVFVVQPAPPGGPPRPAMGEQSPPIDTPPRTRTDAPPVVSRSGNVSDFVQVLTDVSSAAPPVPPAPAPARSREVTWSDKVKAPTPGDFPWDEAPRPQPKTGPKEITWSPDLAAPRPRPEPPARPPEEPEVTLEPLDREPTQALPPPKKKRARSLLIALVALVAVGLGAGGFFLFRYINLAPERLHAAARADYEANNFKPAQDKYDQFVREYPDHELAPEARFFGKLSALRLATTSLTSREDPEPGMKLWSEFVESLKDPQVGQFGEKGRFNIDVHQTGSKLLEDVVAKAKAVFNQDTPDESETWLNHATALDEVLERFRPEEIARPDGLIRDMTALRGQIETARHRLAGLNRIDAVMADGSDEKMQEAQQLALELGLLNDPGFKDRFEKRERSVQEKRFTSRSRSRSRPRPSRTTGSQACFSFHASMKRIPAHSRDKVPSFIAWLAASSTPWTRPADGYSGPPAPASTRT
jgi:hypothetical protein